jgi:hypothetical protein
VREVGRGQLLLLVLLSLLSRVLLSLLLLLELLLSLLKGPVGQRITRGLEGRVM